MPCHATCARGPHLWLRRPFGAGSDAGASPPSPPWPPLAPLPVAPPPPTPPSSPASRRPPRPVRSAAGGPVAAAAPSAAPDSPCLFLGAWRRSAAPTSARRRLTPGPSCPSASLRNHMGYSSQRGKAVATVGLDSIVACPCIPEPAQSGPGYGWMAQLDTATCIALPWAGKYQQGGDVVGAPDATPCSPLHPAPLPFWSLDLNFTVLPFPPHPPRPYHRTWRALRPAAPLPQYHGWRALPPPPRSQHQHLSNALLPLPFALHYLTTPQHRTWRELRPAAPCDSATPQQQRAPQPTGACGQL